MLEADFVVRDSAFPSDDLYKADLHTADPSEEQRTRMIADGEYATRSIAAAAPTTKTSEGQHR